MPTPGMFCVAQKILVTTFLEGSFGWKKEGKYCSVLIYKISLEWNGNASLNI